MFAAPVLPGANPRRTAATASLLRVGYFSFVLLTCEIETHRVDSGLAESDETYGQPFQLQTDLRTELKDPPGGVECRSDGPERGAVDVRVRKPHVVEYLKAFKPQLQTCSLAELVQGEVSHDRHVEISGRTSGYGDHHRPAR